MKAPPRTGARRRSSYGPTGPYGLPIPYGLLDREVDPEQWTHPLGGAGLGEADRAREGVPVGEGERVHAPLGGALGEALRVRGPVPQGEPGNGVQMREARHAHLHHSQGLPRQPYQHSNVCSLLPHPHHRPIPEHVCDIRSDPSHLRKRRVARTVGA